MSDALTKQAVEVGGLPSDVLGVNDCCKVLLEMPSYIMRPRPFTCRICVTSWDFYYADDSSVIWQRAGSILFRSTGSGADR